MSVYGGKCLQHPPLSYTQEELENIKWIKNARAPTTKAIGHPVQCWNWNNAQNKLSEEKRENPVGKTPPQDEHWK